MMCARLCRTLLAVATLVCCTRTAVAFTLEPVPSRSVAIEYRHGMQVVAQATPNGPISIQVAESENGALMIVVAARNDTEIPILFAPETIRTTARMYEGS